MTLIQKYFYFLLNIFILLKYVLTQTYTFDDLDSDYTKASNTKFNHLYTNYGENSYFHTTLFYSYVGSTQSPIVDKINGLTFMGRTPAVIFILKQFF